jgi:hypothetical protein
MRSRSPPPSGRGSGSGPSRARPDGGDEELVERRSRKRRPAGGCGSNPYPRRIRSDALPGGRRQFARLAGAAFDGWRFARVGRRDRILHGPQAVEHGRGNSRATRRRGVALHFLAGPVGQPGGATHAHPHGQVLPLDLAGGTGDEQAQRAQGRRRLGPPSPVKPSTYQAPAGARSDPQGGPDLRVMPWTAGRRALRPNGHPSPEYHRTDGNGAARSAGPFHPGRHPRWPCRPRPRPPRRAGPSAGGIEA